jgi:hypothetical protein
MLPKLSVHKPGKSQEACCRPSERDARLIFHIGHGDKGASLLPPPPRALDFLVPIPVGTLEHNRSSSQGLFNETIGIAGKTCCFQEPKKARTPYFLGGTCERPAFAFCQEANIVGYIQRENSTMKDMKSRKKNGLCTSASAKLRVLCVLCVGAGPVSSQRRRERRDPQREKRKQRAWIYRIQETPLFMSFMVRSLFPPNKTHAARRTARRERIFQKPTAPSAQTVAGFSMSCTRTTTWFSCTSRKPPDI